MLGLITFSATSRRMEARIYDKKFTGAVAKSVWNNRGNRV